LTNIDILTRAKERRPMDLHDHSISWMIAGGLRGDPAELRNRAHLLALRGAEARPSLIERIRAFLTGSTPARATPVDRVCCAA
jgi:hypothetical protein